MDLLLKAAALALFVALFIFVMRVAWWMVLIGLFIWAISQILG